MFGVITRLSLCPLKQCIIKQLLDPIFVASGVIKVSVYQPQPSASADNTYLMHLSKLSRRGEAGHRAGI